MLKIFKLFVLFFALQITTVCAQSSSKEYNEAERLAKEANAQLLAGDVKAGDALIKKSIATYPVFAVFDYAKTVAKLPDLVGANLIMDKVVERVASFPGRTILTDEPNPFVDLSAPGTSKVKEFEKNRAYFNFLNKVYEVNRAYGDRKSILKSLREMQIPVIKIDPNDATSHIEYSMQQSFAKLLEVLEAKPTNENHISENSLKGGYEIMLKNAESFKKKNRPIYYMMLFSIYSAMGDERALDYYNKMLPEHKETNTTYYQLAFLNLAKKDYQAALKNLEISSSLRHKVILADMLIDNWILYKAYGDAYAGLQQYDKAKDQYNIALLYYPEYEPAQKALLQLTSQVAVVIETDKTPPPIIITEPATNRGLEIVSNGNDILVKGTAADPSGLKAVTINGLAVYAQADGNFWGNVALKAGVNKIIVIATDGAGNTSEHTFDIEKKSAIANSAIVPVVLKEGKNYCLLIGAQNYEDINIPSLENPIQDAVRLKLILKKDYDFEDGTIFSLFNPSANDVKRQLLELTNVIQPEDNLLIFYAGHGIWVEKEKKGYWLLVDAKRNDSATWLQNKDVLNLIAKLSSRHTLLITDACFSGGVFKTRSLGKDAPAALKTMNEKISRVAITSGNDTEVPDESVFMKYLVKALTENKEKYLTAQKMFINQIMEAVMTETKTEPRYGTLELAGHIGGDYIFSKK